MKRFLLSSVLLLAMGRAAFGFENDAVIQVPPMTNSIVQLDDPLFINNGTFTVLFPQFFGGMSTYFETTDTLDYTNNGSMTGSAGFDFENFPAAFGQAHMANSFANNANGRGGGTITAIGLFQGVGAFQLGGSSFPLNFDIAGLPLVRVRATNVVNTGLITMDNTGMIDIVGKSVDLRRGQMVMTGGLSFSNSTAGITSLDYGFGVFGTNSGGWNPSTDFGPNFALSPVFTNFMGFGEQMFLTASTPYFQNTSPQAGADGVVVWRIVFLQDNSPPNVTPTVFFDNAAAGSGAFHIQWAGTYRDARTGQIATNYFALSDVPVVRRNTNTFNAFGGIPSDFSFAEGGAPLIIGTPALPAFVPDPFTPTGVTNDFSYINAHPTAVLIDTNQIIGGSVTNLPGRIQLKSLDSMNLADTIISGANYMSVSTPNFLGNSNSAIAAPYADITLGVTNGSLVISNLLIPNLPAWNGVVGAPEAVFGLAPNGGVEAFSGSYFFTTTNIVGTNTIVVTNDVRILMVNSALQPTTPGLEQNMELDTSDSLVINDQLTVFGKFSSNAKRLTLATNDNSAYSLFGTLYLLSPDIFWSSSLPNLQYLTNFGIITTTNLALFADNMPSLFSPRSQAVAYQAFVNHGLIVNQGAFIDANYFENSGSILEDATGSFFGIGGIGNGGIDIRSSIATITNSVLSANNGPVSIAASSLLISNSVVISGRILTLNPSCFLSDGYAFGNQFGHVTNATLPNVVTNGNTFLTGGGVRIPTAPASGDLLGTTITNISVNSLESFNQWPGQDRGVSPSGFAENLALGRMIFTSDGNPSHFTFVTTSGNNALYVDSLEFRNNTTNTDGTGNFTAFTIQPGMKIYYAQAVMNGVSIAEKLNGKNGGGFLWVSNYAGVYSSTNLNGTLYNQALVISPDIDSDHDNTVNRDDPTPIPAGLTFDISNQGPIACGGGGQTGGDTGGDTNSTGGSQQAPGTLAFPAQQTASGSVSFALAQGSYNGLFYETNGVKPARAGFFTAKLTGKGTFSGKLQLGSGTYSISKSFNSSGKFTAIITGKNLAPLKLTLRVVNNDQIVGEVSDMGVTWTAQLLALSEAKNASVFGLGKHSLVLSSDTASGDSFGTMTLGKNGDIQWAGVLPDGGKVSQKSALSKDGVWPLYSPLYSGNGSLIGWLQVTNGTSDIGGSAVLVVPAGQTQLYQNGLTNELNATGSDVTTSSSGTKTLILKGPQLSAPLTNSVTISGKTGQSGNNTLSLSVDVKNGLFNGSVLDPNSGQTLSFQGALVERSGMGGGFFLNATKDQGGKVSLAPVN